MMKFTKTKPYTLEVEIMKVGTWNKRTYAVADLHEIVQSFGELGLSGQVPVGLGHQRKDSEPAEGWITALRVQGDVLVADVQIVNDALIDDIKAGLWRNVSVELALNVQRGKKKYEYVLVGLALLGAVPPAVQGLRPLSDSVSSIVENAKCEGVLTFSRKIDKDDDDSPLKRENTKLVQQLIDAKFNAEIAAGRILPNERERFSKRYKDGATVADAEAWIASAPRPSKGQRQQTRSAEEQVQTYERADVELSARATKLIKELKAQGEQIDLREATFRVLRADPDLAKRYANMPSDRA
jgi:hypothetical protein